MAAKSSRTASVDIGAMATAAIAKLASPDSAVWVAWALDGTGVGVEEGGCSRDEEGHAG